MVLTTVYKNAELGRAFLVFALPRELSRLVSRSFLDLKYRAVARAVVRAVACAAALLIFRASWFFALVLPRSRLYICTSTEWGIQRGTGRTGQAEQDHSDTSTSIRQPRRLGKLCRLYHLAG
jgi:hypothetical protein